MNAENNILETWKQAARKWKKGQFRIGKMQYESLRHVMRKLHWRI